MIRRFMIALLAVSALVLSLLIDNAASAHETGAPMETEVSTVSIGLLV